MFIVKLLNLQLEEKAGAAGLHCCACLYLAQLVPPPSPPIPPSPPSPHKQQHAMSSPPACTGRQLKTTLITYISNNFSNDHSPKVQEYYFSP